MLKTRACRDDRQKERWMARGGGVIVAADLGGSNTDLLLADRAGAILRTAVQPALSAADSASLLDRILPALGVSRDAVETLVVTGGRHRSLPDAIDGIPLQRVDELAAIGLGGLVAAGVERALVVSMGTGTAMVASDGREHQHAIGLALGGGTLLALAYRLLRTGDPLRIAGLAAQGVPARANLTIADVIGSGVGNLPGDAPAAYLARLAGDRFPDQVDEADVAAALLHLIGQVTGHLAWLTARAMEQERIVFIGHMLDFPIVALAAASFGRALPGGVIVPESPGSAVARGALAAALGR
jgi:type II pantothenate kinase